MARKLTIQALLPLFLFTAVSHAAALLTAEPTPTIPILPLLTKTEPESALESNLTCANISFDYMHWTVFNFTYHSSMITSKIPSKSTNQDDDTDALPSGIPWSPVSIDGGNPDDMIHIEVSFNLSNNALPYLEYCSSSITVSLSEAAASEAQWFECEGPYGDGHQVSDGDDDDQLPDGSHDVGASFAKAAEDGIGEAWFKYDPSLGQLFINQTWGCWDEFTEFFNATGVKNITMTCLQTTWDNDTLSESKAGSELADEAGVDGEIYSYDSLDCNPQNLTVMPTAILAWDPHF